MYVITADQVDSRHQADAVDEMLEHIDARYGAVIALPAERTAGDEIQLITNSARAMLEIVKDLARTRQWSIGVGMGSVRHPLAATTRASTGDAFYAARDAVERAKRAPSRFALESATTDDAGLSAGDADALITLLLLHIDRRTDGGWEIYDLLATGITQAEAADKLGITAGAASLRVRAAGIRAEEAASEALVRLLDTIDVMASPPGKKEHNA